jgi:hypothetical protein
VSDKEDVEMINKTIILIPAVILLAVVGLAFGSSDRPVRDAPQPDPKAPASSTVNGAAPESFYDLCWKVYSSGAVSGGSSKYEIKGAVGQTAVGHGVSESFSLSHGYWRQVEKAACCLGLLRGNVDYDAGDGIDISDLVYLVDFMFVSGPEPVCFDEADMNGDDGIDISDLVYLVDFMFTGGPEPLECGETAGAAPAPADDPGLSLELGYEDGYTVITLNSSMETRAVAVHLKGHGGDAPVKLLDDRLDMVHGERDGTVKIGLLDLDGGERIGAGRVQLVKLKGKYDVVLAEVARSGDGKVLPPVVTGKEATLPSSYALHQNYPNPFNPRTQISFSLPQASHVTLEIYNVLGQRVATLADGDLEAGHHTVSWDAAGLASGVYFYRLTAGQFTDRKKMLLLK